MIIGGSASTGSSKKARKTYLRTVQSVQSTGSSLEGERRNGSSIEFSEEEAWRLHHLHDDALVVSIQAGDFNIHRVLVDNGSSANILYYPAFQQMGIAKERLIPACTPLIGFGGSRAMTIEEQRTVAEPVEELEEV
ncbi:uncharacterized protein LOC142615596 [Castanea sativa]|uniref:uncharacterized protein LOC142615596 n=1 Tax=Castanea sativa TaxID=21020 RepID=UPI003F64A9C9